MEEKNNKNEEEECGVCLNSVRREAFVHLPCKHKFCNTCLSVWKKGTCPICRKRFCIDEDLYIEDYLKTKTQWFERVSVDYLTTTNAMIHSSFQNRLQEAERDSEQYTIMENVLNETTSKLSIEFCSVIQYFETMKHELLFTECSTDIKIMHIHQNICGLFENFVLRLNRIVFENEMVLHNRLTHQNEEDMTI